MFWRKKKRFGPIEVERARAKLCWFLKMESSLGVYGSNEDVADVRAAIAFFANDYDSAAMREAIGQLVDENRRLCAELIKLEKKVNPKLPS